MENISTWPNILESVLFAHRTKTHESTGFSPFFILYNRHPVLPLDLQFRQEVSDAKELNIDEIIESMVNIREQIEKTAGVNIKKAQERQRNSYNSRHENKAPIKEGDKVLLRNLKRDDRKGGKVSKPWLGPYTCQNLYKNNCCQLQSNDGTLLKKKYNLKHIGKNFKNNFVTLEKKNCRYFFYVTLQNQKMKMLTITYMKDLIKFLKLIKFCIHMSELVQK